MKVNREHTEVWFGQQTIHHGGFTLIELIMVIILIGVLAIFAAPRMFNTGSFAAQGFHDETLAFLRYAQKTAVAQRRTVCVVFVASEPAKAEFSIASLAASGACDRALAGPAKNCPAALGEPSGCITARAGVSYALSPPSIDFDGLGRPVGVTSPLKLQVANDGVSITPQVTVEAETGYVHE